PRAADRDAPHPPQRRPDRRAGRLLLRLPPLGGRAAPRGAGEGGRAGVVPALRAARPGGPARAVRPRGAARRPLADHHDLRLLTAAPPLLARSRNWIR